ncbi:MAG: hypothetical protein NVS4B8_09390 [Herpetosiphon sp.]
MRSGGGSSLPGSGRGLARTIWRAHMWQRGFNTAPSRMQHAKVGTGRGAGHTRVSGAATTQADGGVRAGSGRSPFFAVDGGLADRFLNFDLDGRELLHPKRR